MVFCRGAVPEATFVFKHALVRDAVSDQFGPSGSRYRPRPKSSDGLEHANRRAMWEMGHGEKNSPRANLVEQIRPLT